MSAAPVVGNDAAANPRDRLLGVVAHLSAAFRELDELGPMLDDPERSALRCVRDDVSEAMRRVSSVAALVAGGR
jgi:hypothetical protein